MSSRIPAARRVIESLFVLWLIVCAAAPLSAQCPVPDAEDLDAGPHPELNVPARKRAPEEPILPEAGFLSNTRYTSQFFGFAFDLPLTVEGHEIMMPIMPEREHALLALQFENGDRRGYMVVTAMDPHPGADLKTPEEKEAQIQKRLQPGDAPDVLPPPPVPDFTHSLFGRFHYSLRREGKNYIAQYWAAMNKYMVKVVVGTNDKEFLRTSRKALQQVQSYCVRDDGTLTDIEGKPVQSEGRPYRGPTVPTFRVEAALHDHPGDNIPSGEVAAGIYRNPDIGIEYAIPAGWQVLHPKPPEPPLDPAGQREYKFLHACSQTLLSLAPAPKAGTPQADTTITLRALDPNCLSLRTPASVADKQTLDEVGASLEQLKEFGEIETDQLVMRSGHLFMIFDGTWDDATAGNELAQRMSQSILVTRYNKLLLLWSVHAPTRKALEAVPAGRITFSATPPIELNRLRATK